ncbi:ATP-binding protein [Streptomyces sp. BI20]|uniref:ATP-binding protein n=1 Tax=Streptomyces sp. BI20 TaxID=3403460 RepID=UPI003C782743
MTERPLFGIRPDLPAEPGHLPGRGRELAGARALLAREPLVTLLGPAGVGKTRIALRLAHERAAAASAAAAGSGAAPATGSAAVSAIGSATGSATGSAGAPGGPPEPLWVDLAGLPARAWDPCHEALLALPRRRPLLLVLDGCEELGPRAADLAASLLAELPRIRILATSQRVLGLPGEMLLPVPPLGASAPRPRPADPDPDPAGPRPGTGPAGQGQGPGPDREPDRDRERVRASAGRPAGAPAPQRARPRTHPRAPVVRTAGVLPAPTAPSTTALLAPAPGLDPAVRCYLDRARLADPGFTLTEDNAADVTALCRALDGLPAALEWVAAQVRPHPPRLALALLRTDPARLLGQLPPDVIAPDPRTSPYAAAARSHRLADPDERLLLTRLTVFGDAFDRAAALDVCGYGPLAPATAGAALTRLLPALPQVSGGTEPDPSRHRVPAALRAHLLSLACAPVARADLATAGRRHHDRCRIRAERAAGLWRTGRQQAARVEALRELPEFRIAMDPARGADPAAALEIAGSLWFLWAACGLAEEGLTHVERALTAHGDRGDRGPSPARALWLASWLATGLRDRTAVEELTVAAWRAAVLEGEDTVLAYLAHVRGVLELWRGRPERAVAEFGEALRTLPRLPEFGPGPGALRAAYTLAQAHADPALVPIEDGPPEDPTDLWARSWAGCAHAVVQRREGRPGEARAELVRSLRCQWALGDRVGQTYALELLAELEADQGRWIAAVRLLGAAAAGRPVMRPGPAAETVLRTRLGAAAYTAAFREGARTPPARLIRPA